MKEFRDAYREAKREVVMAAIARLQGAATEAVDALRAVMNDVENPASARVSAARAVLEIAVRAVEMEDLTARVEEIEAILKREEQGR